MDFFIEQQILRSKLIDLILRPPSTLLSRHCEGFFFFNNTVLMEIHGVVVRMTEAVYMFMCKDNTVFIGTRTEQI